MDKTRVVQVLENAIMYLIKKRIPLTRDRDFDEWQAAVDGIILLERALKEVKNV